MKIIPKKHDGPEPQHTCDVCDTTVEYITTDIETKTERINPRKKKVSKFIRCCCCYDEQFLFSKISKKSGPSMY